MTMRKLIGRVIAVAMAIACSASLAVAQTSPQPVGRGGTGVATIDDRGLIFGRGTSPVVTYGCGANLIMFGGGSTADPFCRPLVGSDLPNPTAKTFGGIFASAPVVGQYISGITSEGKVQRDLQGRFYAASGGGSVTVKAQPGGAPDLWLPSAGAEDYLVSRASTDTLSNKTIDASQLVANTVTNAKLATMASISVKCNDAGSPQNAKDCTTTETQGLLKQGLTLANVLTANNSASFSDTASFGSFNDYMITFSNIVPVTDSVQFTCQVQSGGSFQTTSYLNQAGAATTYIDINSASALSNTAGRGLSGTLYLRNVNSTTDVKMFDGRAYHRSTSGGIAANNPAGYWDGGTGTVTGMRCQMSSGNISTGVMRIYVLRTAL